jgi:hypothetical protein
MFERLSARRTRRREDDGKHGIEESRQSRIVAWPVSPAFAGPKACATTAL